jgi:indole-3-glycerol phosphate synthase
MAAILGRILETKRQEIAVMRSRSLPSRFRPRTKNLKRKLNEPLHILAEIKFKSPSAGPLSTDLSVAKRAEAYERAGASVVSVLCDSTFFGGTYEHLTEARDHCELPLLCKEFVLDEVQLDWAYAFGADFVLLIARCLGPVDLCRLHAAAVERDLTPLVEIATKEEAAWVKALGAQVIGVNARDLDTLIMDAEGCSDILDGIDIAATRLRLSGLKKPSDVVGARDSGLDGALIGEVLMREANPEPLLRALVEAGHP